MADKTKVLDYEGLQELVKHIPQITAGDNVTITPDATHPNKITISSEADGGEEITKAEYDELTDEEKNSGTYYIKDWSQVASGTSGTESSSTPSVEVVTSFSNTLSDEKVPSEKLVKDSLEDLKLIFNTVTIAGTVYAGVINGKSLSLMQAGLYDANWNLIQSLTLEQTGTNASKVKSLLTENVKRVVLPNGVTSIDNEAFYNCSNLISIILPNGITTIDVSAFRNCSSLTSMILPDSITTLESSSFNGCSSLTSISIPSNVTNIGANAFYGCTSLTSVIIPDGVTTIGYSSFYNCSSLTSVKIPNSVINIYGFAFADCTSLSSVVIPDSVTTISFNAFEGIPHIYYNGTATGSPWGALAIN